jgi:MFS family permease
MTTTSTWFALRNPTFRVLWIASIISGCSVSAHDTAALWLMNKLGASSFQLSLMATASALPFFLFTLPAGAAADTVDRKRMLMGTNLWLAVSAALLALIGWNGLISPSLVLAAVFLIGIGFAFNAPTYSSAITDIVTSQELSSAVTLGGMQMNLASILGPAIGGTLLSVIGPYTVFSINSVCFLLVGAAVLGWRRLYCRLPLEKFAQSLIGAIRYVRYTPGVQVVLARNFLFAVFISAIPALLPIVALKKLHFTPGELGLVFTSMGVGALLCAVVVLPLGRGRLSPNLLTLIANFLLCVVFVVMALARLQLLLFVVSGFAGIAWTLAASELWVAAQRSMPEWARGRLNAVHMMSSQGGMALGAIGWGTLVTLTNIELTLFAAALILFPLSLLLRPLSIDFTENLNIESSPLPTRFHRFPRFPKPEDGPVVIYIDYHVAAENRENFMMAMHGMRSLMLRNGATTWQLQQDLEDPNRFRMEMLVASWSEHLRQHERMTKFELKTWEIASSYHLDGDPVPVKHFLSVDREVFLLGQTTR